jgi:uncharacterized protein (TIGR02301 family)
MISISAHIRSVLIASVCVIPMLLGSAQGQTQTSDDGLPPYEDELLRLVSIMGSLEFLHPLCGQHPRGVWRDQMANLLDAEEPVPARRARIMAAYNKAFALLDQVYKTCTPAAQAILQRYETEAVELTRTMATNYRPIQAAPAEATDDSASDETETTAEPAQ